jgi:hypothetical protein
MNKENKKKKLISILSKLSEKEEKAKADLANHEFYIDRVKEKVSLFDYVMFQAIMEQAEGLALTFNKPHSYQLENAEAPRLSKEVYDALEKSAILRPTRMGYLSLIS